MPDPLLAGRLARATPMAMLAPSVLRGPLGAPLAAEQALLRQNLEKPRAVKFGDREVLCVDGLAAAAVLVERLAALQPAISDVSLNGFHRAPGPEASQWQATALQACFTAATALAVVRRGDEKGARPNFAEVVRLAFSATAAGATLRDQLGNWLEHPRMPDKRMPGVPGLPPFAQELLVQVEKLVGSTCALATVAALEHWAGALASQSPYYLKNTIRSLAPADACPGGQLTLTGTGFGDGTHGAVVFTGASGGSVVVAAADVVKWTDTEIIVTVPAQARRGPVGVVVFPQSGGGTLASAASTAAGELGACFGPLATARVQQTLGRFTHPILASPALQADGRNLFLGGPPLIRRFVASPRGILYPQQAITLDWIVEGADRVEIVSRNVAGSQPHELPAITEVLVPDAGSVGVVVPGSRRWKGEYVLRAFNKCTGERGPAEAVLPLEMGLRQGLALGGGGTRGDFQVGALLYLYNERKFRPEAIAATSVGAVNSIDLVMGDDPGQNAAQRLRDIWLTLNGEDDMWGEEPWLGGLKPSLRRALRSLSLEGLLTPNPALATLGFAALDVYTLLTNLRGRGAVSMFNIDPIEARMRAMFDPVRAIDSGIDLRLVAVSVETGDVVQVTETGRVISDLTRAPSLPPGTPPAPTTDAVDGAVASAAMPGIFRARRLGDHNCVDGGVRDVVPVSIAVSDLGCNRVIAIRCSAAMQVEALDMQRAFPSIAARSVLGVTFDEVADDDVAPFNGWGPGVEVIVIRPSFDLHDPLVVEPGLIRIAMDYGWMRAADVLDVPAAQRARAQALCDEIIQLRIQNWQLAHYANGDRPEDPHRDFTDFLVQGVIVSRPQTAGVPDPAAVTQVRANARVIRDRLATRMMLGMPVPEPAVSNAWFQQWEMFPFGGALLMPDPWAAFSSRIGTLPAEAVPPSL